jgi:hypothetical protein
MLLLIIAAISLVLGAWLILCCLRVIRVRQGLVIYSRITGNVCHIIAGPRVVLIWPLQNTLLLDLSIRAARLSANDLVTSDLAITASLDIFYAFDPTLLQAANLDWVLPALPQAERIVQAWADYILRSLATGCVTAELVTVPACRARLESQLRNTLQDRLQPLGLHVQTIRLLCRPAPMMLEAQLAAARTQLAAQARAQALELLASALGPDYHLTDILPLELLQKIHPQGDSSTYLNLSLPVTSKMNDQDSLLMHWMLASR